MPRTTSPLLYTRPSRDSTRSWQRLIDADGNLLHDVFVGGEQMPGVQVVSHEYVGARYGLSYRYSAAGRPELGLFARSSDAVYALAAVVPAIRSWLVARGEPNAWYRPSPVREG